MLSACYYAIFFLNIPLHGVWYIYQYRMATGGGTSSW